MFKIVLKFQVAQLTSYWKNWMDYIASIHLGNTEKGKMRAKESKKQLLANGFLKKACSKTLLI